MSQDSMYSPAVRRYDLERTGFCVATAASVRNEADLTSSDQVLQ
jgi:hypothetical protein